MVNYVAIDPLALVLSNEVYVKINLPYPQPVLDSLDDLVKAMDPAAKRLALDRAKAMRAYADAVVRAVNAAS